MADTERLFGRRWPHLGNALKYATAMSVSLFGTFQPQMKSSWVWVFCFVYATLYQFTWDVVMDWDLLRWCVRACVWRRKERKMRNDLVI